MSISHSKDFIQRQIATTRTVRRRGKWRRLLDKVIVAGRLGAQVKTPSSDSLGLEKRGQNSPWNNIWTEVRMVNNLVLGQDGVFLLAKAVWVEIKKRGFLLARIKDRTELFYWLKLENRYEFRSKGWLPIGLSCFKIRDGVWMELSYWLKLENQQSLD